MAITASATPAVDTSPYAYRNLIRNGDFSIAQRGTFIPVTAGATSFAGYGLDGWYYSWNGVADSNGYSARGAFSPGYNKSKYGGMFNTGSQTSAGHFSRAEHRIEDVTKLAGKTVTLSFNAYGNEGPGRIGLQFAQNFGTSGSATVTTNLGNVKLTVDGPRRYFITFTVPSVSGKTINADNYLNVLFWFSSGSTNNTAAQGIGLHNGVVILTDVQLEEGPIATPFEEMSPVVQLMWNQRYFTSVRHYDYYARYGSGHAQTSTSAAITFVLPVEMRKPVNPTLVSATYQTYLWNGVTNFPATSLSNGAAHPRTPTASISASGGGMTPGQQIHWTNGVTGQWAGADFSAEY